MLFFIRFCQRGHLRKGGHGGSGEIGNFVLSAPTCEGAPYHCEIRWWVLQIEVLENAVYYNGASRKKHFTVLLPRVRNYIVCIVINNHLNKISKLSW